MKFKEFLNSLNSLNSINEVKAGRAWLGQLNKIDSFIAWLYDEDILTKAEKNKKDSLFNKYYRYYNDGDFPRGLKDEHGKTVYKGELKSNIKRALEYQLEEYMKKILTRYLPKIDRSKFRNSEIMKSIDGILEDLDHLNTGFIYSKLKDSDDLIIKSLVFHLNKKASIILKSINNSYNLSYNYDHNLVPDKYLDTYSEVVKLADKLKERLEIYKTGVKKLTSLKLLK